MKVHLGINNIYAAKRWPEPDVWGRQVAERWGLKHVQFCFDLLDPRSEEPARAAMCAQVRAASKKYGFEIHSGFTGVGAYAYNLLLHPMPELRQDAVRWCELASITSAQMGAQGTGGPVGAASETDYRNPARRELLMELLIEGMHAFACHAAKQGLKFLVWEPTPIAREMLIRLDEAKQLHEKLNRNSAVPIHFLLDVGHQCSYEASGKDRDTYLWLRELGSISPAIHLQQMDGVADRHWTFTRAHNAEGVVDMEKVMKALDESGAEEVFLFPELIHPFEYEEEKILAEMDESYAYLRQFVA